MEYKKYSFLIGLLLTLTLLWPLLLRGYFSHHLDYQIIRIYEMDKCFKDLQIPCRWAADLGGLYGTPLFSYVAPLPYYFAGAFFFITNSLLFSYKLTFIVAFVAAYIFMYLLSSRLWGQLGGALSAILYVLAPYQAVTLYVRGDVGQLWSMALAPAVIWAILRLISDVRVINVLLVSLLICFLILSHNLFAFIFLPLIALLVVVFTIQNRGVRLIRFITLAVIVGVLLSSFYLIPSILEKDLIHDSTISWPHLSYTEHFKGLRKLILERSWGWGSSVREVPGVQGSTMSFQIGWIHLLILVVVLLNIRALFYKNKKLSALTIFSASMILVSIFMIHPKSEIVWKVLGFLKYLEYPWQFLSVVVFFISLVAGSLMYLYDSSKRILLYNLLIVTAVVVFNFSYFRPEKIFSLSDELILSGKLWEEFIKKSNFEYLPVDTKTPPKSLPRSRYEIIGGKSELSNFKEGSNWITFDTDASTLVVIRLSQHYFPNWEVAVDGKMVAINPQNELGLITFAIDPGKHHIVARLKDTPVRIISNLISLLGGFMFLVLVLTQLQKTRRWLLYYIQALNR